MYIMNPVARLEKKYILSAVEAANLSYRLGAVFQRDRHSENRPYLVRSLYFDTPDNDDFHDKQEGLEYRRKVRLRIYSPSDKFAKLEFKQKQGKWGQKKSVRVSMDDAQRIIDGRYSVLLSYADEFAQFMFAFMSANCYRPKAIVEYEREAFIVSGNNIRITLDRNISATEANYDLFSERLSLYPVYDRESAVLEVKYNGVMLKYVKDILNSVDKINTSVSKYVMARSVSMRNMHS